MVKTAGIAVAAVSLVTAALAVSCLMSGKEDSTINPQTSNMEIPAIDARAPAVVETATFALG